MQAADRLNNLPQPNLTVAPVVPPTEPEPGRDTPPPAGGAPTPPVAAEGFLDRAKSALGLKKKATVEVETTPANEQVFDASDFGVLAKIGPQGADKVRLQEETRLGMEAALTMMVSDLQHYEEFMRINDPKQKRSDILTADQIALLDFYRSNGTNLLDTARGWMLANMVVEEEMRLRAAILQKNLAMEMEHISADKSADKNEVVVTVKEAEGWIDKYGLDLWKRGSEAITRIIEGARKGPIKLKLKDYKVDLSSLPPQIQKYMEYINPRGAGSKRKISEFLAQAGKVRLDFCEALGTPPEAFNEVPTWWTKFVVNGTNPATIAKAQEMVSTIWSQAREGMLRAIIQEGKGPSGATLDMKSKAHVAWVTREANARTIQYLLKLRQEEIFEGRSADKQPLTATVKTLTERRAKMEAKTPPAGQKVALEKEQQAKTQELADVKAERDRQEAKKKADEQRLAGLPKEKEDLESQQAQLEGRMAPLIASRKRFLERLEVLTKTHQAQVAAMKGREAQASLEALTLAYQRDSEPINKDIAIIDVDQGLNALESEFGKLKAQIDHLPKEDVLGQSIETATTKMHAAIAKILEIEKRMDGIKEDLKAYLSDEEKAARSQKLEVSLIALQRVDEIQAVDPMVVKPEAVVKVYTDTKPAQADLDNLAFTAQDRTDVGGVPSKAYMAFIRQVFDPDHYTGEMSMHDYWKKCMEVLPQDALAEVLIEHFNQEGAISILAPTSTLDQSLGLMELWGLSPLELRKVFMSVLNKVKMRGLMI